jgi:hypothetical protein
MTFAHSVLAVQHSSLLILMLALMMLLIACLVLQAARRSIYVAQTYAWWRMAETGKKARTGENRVA